MKRTASEGMDTRRGQGNWEISVETKLATPQKRFYPLLHLFHVPELTLPNYETSPSEISQFGSILEVSPFVSFELWNPVVLFGLRDPRNRTAAVEMPKASVKKQGFSFYRKDKVRTAGQILGVQAILVPKGSENLAEHSFRDSILTSNTPHVFASLFGREFVHTSWLKRQIQGQVGDISKAPSFDQRFQHILSVRIVHFGKGLRQFGERKVIHAIDISCSQTD